MPKDGIRSSAALVMVLTAALAIAVSTACGGDDSSTATAASPGDPTETAVPTSAPTLALGSELLSDGSFETGNLDIWELRQNERQAIELSTAQARSGTSSLHMTTPSDEGDWPWVILQENFPVQAGATYRVAGFSRQDEFGPMQVLFDFYDDQGEFIIRNSYGDWGSSGEVWLGMNFTREAPVGAVTGRLIVQLRILDDEIEGGPPGQLELFVDDLSVREVLE